MLVLAFVVGATTAQAQVGVVLYDPLQGSTIGVRNGGVFAGGGWQCTDPSHGNDYIYWHLPRTVIHGKAEFYAKGISGSYPAKTEQFHMYDNTYQSADSNYTGYRNNPYKMLIRKSENNSCEIINIILGDDLDADTQVLSWDPAHNYRITVEWGPDGNGNSYLKLSQDGVQFLNRSIVGTYAPTGHSVRIGAARNSGEGSMQGAIYSYMTVTDMSELVVPAAPAVVQPGNGTTITSRTPTIKWHGVPHT